MIAAPQDSELRSECMKELGLSIEPSSAGTVMDVITKYGQQKADELQACVESKKQGKKDKSGKSDKRKFIETALIVLIAVVAGYMVYKSYK